MQKNKAEEHIGFHSYEQEQEPEAIMGIDSYTGAYMQAWFYSLCCWYMKR